MEVCEDNQARRTSEFDKVVAFPDDQNVTNINVSGQIDSSGISGSGNNVKDFSHADLDKNLLLSLFGGNAGNVEYYCELRNFTSRKAEGQGLLTCDPRDVRKVEQTRNWQPKSETKTEDLKDLIKQWKAANLDFPSKQIAVELEGGDSLIGEGDSDGKSDVHEDKDKEKCQSFHCGVQGCDEVFISLALYEAHYCRCHSYSCATCRRSFVSNFLLDVHVQENHDSYFQILSSRMDMYRCLVESCNLKFRTADVRKEHMITAHKFPSNFSFHRPLKEFNSSSTKVPDEDGMDVAIGGIENESGGQRLKSQAKKKGRKGCRDKDVDEKKISNQCMPTAICFGRGSQRAFQRRGRGGRGRHWHQAGRPDVNTRVDIESVDMKDLADSLR